MKCIDIRWFSLALFGGVFLASAIVSIETDPMLDVLADIALMGALMAISVWLILVQVKRFTPQSVGLLAASVVFAAAMALIFFAVQVADQRARAEVFRFGETFYVDKPIFFGDLNTGNYTTRACLDDKVGLMVLERSNRSDHRYYLVTGVPEALHACTMDREIQVVH